MRSMLYYIYSNILSIKQLIVLIVNIKQQMNLKEK